MKACAVHIIIKNKGFKIVGITQEKSKSRDLLFSIQSEGLAWNHRAKCGVCNPSHSDGMAYSLLAHRLHGGTSCYVPSLTERSRSNLHSLADKQACRLASLDYHAPACIFLRIDAIHHFVMIPYGTSCQFHTADKLRISYTASP